VLIHGLILGVGFVVCARCSLVIQLAGQTGLRSLDRLRLNEQRGSQPETVGQREVLAGNGKKIAPGGQWEIGFKTAIQEAARLVTPGNH
jgi:hypothetical protein